MTSEIEKKKQGLQRHKRNELELNIKKEIVKKTKRRDEKEIRKRK